MPLNLSNRDQSSGHLFYNRRLRAALTRFSVRMKHDDRKQQAAVAMSVVLVVLGCAWMALLQVIKPVGVVGQSPIVGNRDTGALYARVEGRLYPALNLTSARLVVGSPVAPTWLPSSEIDKHPTGPMIGIPGIPDDVAVSTNPLSAWAVCDTASRDAVTVTAISGELLTAGRAGPLRQSEAILAVHDNVTYLIWNGRRTPVNLADRVVTFNLGLDSGSPRPVPVSTALFDAMPATEPLVVPMISDAGSPSRWLPGAAVGQVLVTEDVNGASNGYYVLLADGVQRITAFVADLLRTSGRSVSPPQLVPPSTVVDIPEVHPLNVDYYPTAKIRFIDTGANPVTCVGWRKRSTDRRSTATFFTGRGLPTPPDLDARIVVLAGGSRPSNSVAAQQVLIIPGAATLVVSTGGSPVSDTREVLYWVSPQGVRYGIDQDETTLSALGLDPDRALQAPWPLLRTFAPGPAISRADALVVRDAIDPTEGAAPTTAAENSRGRR